MTDTILTRSQDRVLHITINRPDKKNALSAAMYAALADALTQAETDAAVQVVTITGAGDSFTAGNDIADFLQNPPLNDDSPVWQFLRAISAATKPVIAAVNGIAVGVGVTLLLHCDLVYAAESAVFQLPFINLALLPEAASSLLLPRLIGHQRASELLMFGESFDAMRARELGLVNALYPASDLAAAVEERARVLAAKPPEAIRIVKSLLKGNGPEIQARMREEAALFVGRLASDEAQQALQRFMQRRKPA
jgi:enoyl-CoA hydratase/carnithine racemase